MALTIGLTIRVYIHRSILGLDPQDLSAILKADVIVHSNSKR